MEAVMQMREELAKQKNYTFNTDSITYSFGLKGDKNAYVTGYISTSEQDLYDDIITEEALKSMMEQIQNSTITIDYEHEAFRDDSSILPVGKIIEAKVDDRGLWVKCKLNKFSPKFKALWGSIKEEFVNAFSIAFKPLEIVEKMVGDVKVRMIKSLKLLNVAFTGAPINEGARVDGWDMKSIMLKAINDTIEEQVLVSKRLLTKLMEEKSMEPENKPEDAVKPEGEAVEAPAEAPAEASTEPVEEKAEPEPEVEAPAESEADEDPVEAKALAELTKNVDKLAKENAELKSDLKTLKETEVFKSPAASSPDLKGQDKPINMLSLVH